MSHIQTFELKFASIYKITPDSKRIFMNNDRLKSVILDIKTKK